jgi:hypothetical protein
MEYQTSIVENMLRNYYSLKEHTDPTFTDMYVDLITGLKELYRANKILYKTIINVFVLGYPIVKQAELDNITTRQVSYRLDDALSTLTSIMNGDKDAG